MFVAPTGESLLIDTGNPGARDVDRITEVIENAGVNQIDNMVTSHDHVDHVGGLEELAKRFPIKHYYDHGATVEPNEQVRGFQAMYAGLWANAAHTVVKPGDTIPLGAK